MANPEPAAPALEFVFSANVTIDPAQEHGDIGKGRRRVVPITGGDFAGPQLSGTVMPGGADWQIIRSDGVAELDARYTLRTDDGALIHVRNRALRHGPPEVMAALAAGRPVAADRYYFRGATFFETGAEPYAWLARHVVICSGNREAALVKLNFFKTL